MTLTRRQTLAVIGGGVILAGGAAGAHVSRAPNDALAPWKNAGTYSDPRKSALSWAILAPNPHNRQPWMVDLSKPDEVSLYVDTTRLLPHTDPFSRQITIGLGCFLEVLRMAALEDGFAAKISPFPEGFDDGELDARPVARIRFLPTEAPRDPLFVHVPTRRTLKEPFDINRTVPSDALARITAAALMTNVTASNTENDVTALRQLSRDALVIEIETPHTYKESVDLFRIGRAEVNANPDGIDFSGPMFETLSILGLFNRDVVMDRSSMSFAQGLAAVLENADTAMAHVWQVTETNTRLDQLNAGRDWVRINLAATAEGLGIQPLSQALQEYPEMDALYADIHNRLAPEGGTVQMFARLGYGPDVAVSPRWPLEAKLTNV